MFYIAAEGAAGLRKRKVGFERANPGLPEHVPFSMIAAAPNLGTASGDLERLIAAVEATGVHPGCIALDTLAQSLGSGDENGAGMIQLLANATALANHFQCFVPIVHHIGLAEDRRMRGHSSLVAGIDALILCERKEGLMQTTLTVQKLKDEESGLKFTAHLSRVPIGQDDDREDISTLVVDTIEDGGIAGPQNSTRQPPVAHRLLMAVVKAALDDAGALTRPLGTDGPQVQTVAESAIRARYYARIAEKAKPDEDKATLAERQRKSFNRTLAPALTKMILMAGVQGDERVIWLP